LAVIEIFALYFKGKRKVTNLKKTAIRTIFGKALALQPQKVKRVDRFVPCL
jgi:hypothetical protein